MSISNEKLLAKANKAFMIGDYQKAINLYEKIRVLAPELKICTGLNIALAKKSVGLITDVEKELKALSVGPENESNILCDKSSLSAVSGLENVQNDMAQQLRGSPFFC